MVWSVLVILFNYDNVNNDQPLIELKYFYTNKKNYLLEYFKYNLKGEK